MSRDEQQPQPIDPQHMRTLIRAVAEFTVLMGRVGQSLARRRRQMEEFLRNQDPRNN
jgi:hypothetical protein